MFVYGIYIEGLVACLIFIVILISVYYKKLIKNGLLEIDPSKFKINLIITIIVATILLYIFIIGFIMILYQENDLSKLNSPFIFSIAFICGAILSTFSCYLALIMLKRRNRFKQIENKQ